MNNHENTDELILNIIIPHYKISKVHTILTRRVRLNDKRLDTTLEGTSSSRICSTRMEVALKAMSLLLLGLSMCRKFTT